MTRAKISVIKARFSAFIARARKGDSIIVMDRDTPVAKIVPWDEPSQVVILSTPTQPPSSVRGRSPVKVLTPVDSTALLRQDRDGR